jgi:hypothetical protein
MPRRLTIEEAERCCPNMAPGQRWRGAHANYRFLCSTHGEYKQTYSDHEQGRRCRQCGHDALAASCRLTIEEAEARHSDMVKGQTWRGAHSIYRFRCSTHGEYTQIYDGHNRGARCPLCARQRSNDKRRLSIEKVERRFPGELASGQSYRKNNQPLEWKCLAGLGHENYFQPYDRHDRGASCPPCGRIKAANTHRTPAEKIEKEFPGELVPGQVYHDSHQLLLWRCLAGYGHEDYPQPYTCRRRQVGCPRCKESRGEKRIAQFVGQFKRQARFADCRNIRTLPFDFIVQGRKILVEYHGEQHYRPSRWLGGKNKFIRTQHHDTIKRRWARRNGYKLIEIPYTVKDVEGYLLQRLSRFTADFVHFNKRTRLASTATS